MGRGQSPGGNQVAKLPEAPRITYFHLNHLFFIKIYPLQPVTKTNSTFFSKILPKFELEVNFSVKSYASLTCEDPAYLQITFHTYPT